MAAPQFMFQLDAALCGLRALVDEATTTDSVAFVLVLIFLFCLLKNFGDRTGLADTKITSMAQSTGLIEKIKVALRSIAN